MLARAVMPTPSTITLYAEGAWDNRYVFTVLVALDEKGRGRAFGVWSSVHP